MTEDGPAAVVVLAAGQGTRMKSVIPKVMHTLLGRSLLGHVLAATHDLRADRTIVVVGHDRDAVTEHLAEIAPDAHPVTQAEQHGTGHAVQLALDAMADVEGTVVVVPGDTPLLTTGSLATLIARHLETRAAATVLTASVPNPAGYGRICRDPDGFVTGIVEERDADDATKRVDEVNTGVYAFEAGDLRAALAEVGSDNAQGEQYLTDVIGILRENGQVVASVTAEDYRETLGVNDRVQLAEARRLMRDRINEHWMREGVTILDPQTTWIGVRVRLEADSFIHQNTQLHGDTTVAKYADVGPDSTLRSVVVGEGASVVKSHCTRAEIGPGARVGPFAYLRPGTRLGPDAKAGAFTELKNSTLGEGAKVPHLSYVGDADVGDRSNIGAATITVNYDGAAKHRTTIGEDARVGSDTMLVAPVSVGDGAYTAAGSVITEDVPPGAIGVGRARQRNVDGWVERKRPGTPSAEAARRARERDTMEAASPASSPQNAQASEATDHQGDRP